MSETYDMMEIFRPVCLRAEALRKKYGLLWLHCRNINV